MILPTLTMHSPLNKKRTQTGTVKEALKMQEKQQR